MFSVTNHGGTQVKTTLRHGVNCLTRVGMPITKKTEDDKEKGDSRTLLLGTSLVQPLWKLRGGSPQN